jgi:Mg2+/Co2+ transporter CorB
MTHQSEEENPRIEELINEEDIITSIIGQQTRQENKFVSSQEYIEARKNQRLWETKQKMSDQRYWERANANKSQNIDSRKKKGNVKCLNGLLLNHTEEKPKGDHWTEILLDPRSWDLKKSPLNAQTNGS